MDELTSALTASSRRELRARAHGLEPVVLMGGNGLTAAVLAEIDRALTAHELIKIRSQAERDDRGRLMAEICAGTKALAVQHIGKMLVVYRKKPPEVTKAEDREKTRKAAARKAEARKTARSETAAKRAKPSKSRPKAGARTARGTGRPGSRTASPRRAPERPLRRPRTSR